MDQEDTIEEEALHSSLGVDGAGEDSHHRGRDYHVTEEDHHSTFVAVAVVVHHSTHLTVVEGHSHRAVEGELTAGTQVLRSRGWDKSRELVVVAASSHFVLVEEEEEVLEKGRNLGSDAEQKDLVCPNYSHGHHDHERRYGFPCKSCLHVTSRGFVPYISPRRSRVA